MSTTDSTQEFTIIALEYSSSYFTSTSVILSHNQENNIERSPLRS